MQNDTYLTKALDMNTWPDFETLAEKHNGVWGGCWCMSFHSEGANKSTTYELNHQRKAQRVSEGRAHAALVYVGGIAVGWCQFGPTEELPHIKHAREYTAKLTDLPDWRITCFFVNRDYRKQGVASAALAGALEQIAVLGGGVVESYPEDVSGRKVSSTFIHNATLSLFEQYGFKKIRPLGKNNWVVQKFVSPNP